MPIQGFIHLASLNSSSYIRFLQFGFIVVCAAITLLAWNDHSNMFYAALNGIVGSVLAMQGLYNLRQLKHLTADESSWARAMALDLLILLVCALLMFALLQYGLLFTSLLQGPQADASRPLYGLLALGLAVLLAPGINRLTYPT